MAVLLEGKVKLFLSRFLIDLFPYIITFTKDVSASDNTRLLFKRNASKSNLFLKDKIKISILSNYRKLLLYLILYYNLKLVFYF